MLKPNNLRAHLGAATPELRSDPDKLAIFVTHGKLVCAGASSLSHEYRYTLKLVLLDYAGEPDAIMVPLLAWLEHNQLEIFENPDWRERCVRFEVEYLNKEAIDLAIEVDLRERVIVTPGPDPASTDTARRYTVTHIGEPPRVGVAGGA